MSVDEWEPGHRVGFEVEDGSRFFGEVVSVGPGQVTLQALNSVAPLYDYVTVCGDVSGPNGVGGECVLGPGHPHRDGIGGEWGGIPQPRGHLMRSITKDDNGRDVFGPERPCGVCGGPEVDA